MNLASFTDVLADEISNSQPMSLPSSVESRSATNYYNSNDSRAKKRPAKGTGQRGHFRSIEEIDPKYRDVFTYPYFNLVQSRVIEDALYSDKSIVVCAPTGAGKTVVFEMAIVQLLMDLEDKQYSEDFKIIYMAPVKALCTERLTEWYTKFTKLGLLCIEVTGDTDVDFTQLKPYKIIITTPEKWDMLTRRWRDHRSLVEVIKLFLIDEVHILNDEVRGPVLEAVVSRMKTIESSAQSVHRIEKLQTELEGGTASNKSAPRIRFVAVSATVSNPEDVAKWLETSDKPAVFYKFGDECRPVKLKRIVEGYPCSEGTSIFKFDIILNYKLWPIIQKYHCGKPTLIFCNTRKSVILTAETLSRELTVSFNPEQTAKLTALASTIKNKKLQALVMNGIGCHHAGLLYEERQNIELAFRNRDLPILITTTTLAMGVNLPAHLVIVKNTQQYVNGAYQEYSISTVLQMVGRAGRPQFDTEATAVIMTRLVDKPRYQALVGGCEPLQSYLHKRLAENLNSEAALGTVGDVAQCVQWLRSTFLYVRAARDAKKYLGLPQNSPQHLISKKIEELCVKAMNGLASSGLITMDEASCIESTEAGRLMSIFYLDLETMKLIMKIEGIETLDQLLALICESHELADMHLRVDERRCLNTLNRNNAAATVRFPMKGKITTRQMKLNCIIQAVLGCLTIPDPSLNQEAMKVMRIADRVCKCLVTYITRPDIVSCQPQFYAAVLNSIILEKCIKAHLWENSPFVSRQLKGIGPTFSSLLASAGKVNFMMLEESHPRDLERIMNKGAPAGNILRKQISLLPKYQLAMIPVDENAVTIQLVLLNQSHLAEDMDNLTAGSNHKSYIIVGDSENHLLLLAAFKEKDLISVFDGTISHEVRRKHNFEHKIFAHCISSSFVGIDVQSEYLFNDLEPFLRGPSAKIPKNDITTNKIAGKQTCITDMFKERKRKNTDVIDKTQSKEKMKRDSAIIENFKHLKESLETASKNLKHCPIQRKILEVKPNKTPVMITNASSNQLCVINTNSKNYYNTLFDQNNVIENVDNDDFIDDEKIDSILNEIESEMNRSKKSSASNNSILCHRKSLSNINPLTVKAASPKCGWMQNFYSKHGSKRLVTDTKKRKSTSSKTNYNFIDLLERNLNISDDDSEIVPEKNKNGFSETIKNQIQNYLSKTHTKVNTLDKSVEILLEIPEKDMANENATLPEINSDYKRYFNVHPRYEIKEILDSKNCTQRNKSAENPQEVCNKTSTCNAPSLMIDDIKNDNTTNPYIEIKRKYKPMQDTNSILILNDINFSNSNNNEFNKEEASHRILGDKKMFFTGAEKSSSENKSIDEKNTKKIISCIGDQDSKKTSTKVFLELNVNYLDQDVNMADIKEAKYDIDQSNNYFLNNICGNIKDCTETVTGYQPTKVNQLNKICIPPMGSGSSKIKPKVYESSVPTVFSPDLIKQYVENNTTSENVNTLSTKDFSLMYANQAQCNKKIKFPTVKEFVCPYVSNMLDDGQKLRNYLPEVEASKQKTEFIKEYAFSASKIDVHAEQTPEYNVQVIQKIRLDMDITTIFSRKHNYSHGHNNEYEHSSKNSEKTTDIEVPNSNNTHSVQSTQDNNSITDESKDSTNRLKVVNEQDKLQTIPYTRANNLIKPHNRIIPKKIESKNYENNPHNHFTKRSKDMSIVPKYEIPKNYDLKEQGNVNNDYENGREKLAEVDSIRRSLNENNKIQNILQKYGKILGKTPAINITSSCLSNKKMIGTKSPVIKTKKPFKITDIHKLHAPLPWTIIDSKPELETNYLGSPKTQFDENENIYVDREIDPNLHAQCTDTVPTTEMITKHDSASDLYLEAIHLPTHVEFEPSKEFKMDQLMFNPKTLLECVVNEDIKEIIPPPLEFCDSVTNPCDFNHIKAFTADDKCFESQLVDCSGRGDNQNESIFEDNICPELTPSREIETWNLSRENSWDPYTFKNISPAKSFTVMRRNNLHDHIFSQNSMISRRDRLGKFKFNKKNRLKIRK